MHVHVEYDHAPSALRFMTSALLRRARTTDLDASVSARWRGCRATKRQLDQFQWLTNLLVDDHVPLMFAQMIGFRLNMAVLTHPRFPLPIWRALQIRNSITQHIPISVSGDYVVETATSAQRVLEKGLEIDLRTTLTNGETLFWEGINTFYYRGRYGVPQAPSPGSVSPTAPTLTKSCWPSPRNTGLAAARLTGDYNGVHLSDVYARLFGFSRAFAHPPLLAAQCLARLHPISVWPQQVRLWLKGQAPYGGALRLCADETAGRAKFALFHDSEERPVMLGDWRSLTTSDAQAGAFATPVRHPSDRRATWQATGS